MNKDKIKDAMFEVYRTQEKYRRTGSHELISVDERFAVKEGKILIKDFLVKAKKEKATKEGHNRVLEYYEDIAFISSFGNQTFEIKMEAARLLHDGEYKEANNLLISHVKSIKSRLRLL